MTNPFPVNGNFNGGNDYRLPDDAIPIEHDLFVAMTPPAWWKDALCRRNPDKSITIDTFYPEAGKHGGNHLAPARRVCLQCPVRYLCLEDGLDEQWGVWGGHSPSQRRKIGALLKKGSTLEEASQAIDARSRDNAR